MYLLLIELIHNLYTENSLFLFIFRASVTIQRKYRTYKGWNLPETYANIHDIRTPPTSPSLPPPQDNVSTVPVLSSNLLPITKLSGAISNRTDTPSGTTAGPQTATDIMRVDYDSYLLNRRPGSTTYSEVKFNNIN